MFDKNSYIIESPTEYAFDLFDLDYDYPGIASEIFEAYADIYGIDPADEQAINEQFKEDGLVVQIRQEGRHFEVGYPLDHLFLVQDDRFHERVL